MSITGGMQGTLGGMALVYMYTATDQDFVDVGGGTTLTKNRYLYINDLHHSGAFIYTFLLTLLMAGKKYY